MFRLPPAHLLIEAQTTPSVPAPQPAPSPAPEVSPIGTYVGIAVIALLVLLAALAFRKLFFKRPLPPPPKPAAPEEKPELPPVQAFKVELPQSAQESQRRAEAAELHRQAEELARKRQELAESATKAAAEEKARLEAEANELKAREEEAKRAEYRAKKAAEQEERERHKRERQEAERLRREAEEQARHEAEARKQAEFEAERRKIEAEAGRTLAQGLDKTKTQGFMARLNSFFGEKKPVDESVLAELEEILFTADIGVRTASKLVETVREKAKRNELTDPAKVKDLIRAEIARIVDLPVKITPLEGGGPPHVVMVVGVNGAGKTTTIGKLAAKLTRSGKKVVLGAADTFRAAATEQLEVWSQRAEAELVRGPEGSDPGSVAFEATKKGRESGASVVVIDTAGRLQTKAPLMEELKKVQRVTDKALPGAPHEVLLVVDATTGQNAIQQAKLFSEAVPITGIALTKLDGTAKGGVIIGICDELKIPVLWVGVGEKVEDLRSFDPKEFVAALFD